MPAYVLSHDATLRQIATLAPLPLLGTVSGVGGNEVVKYGQQVLDALASGGQAVTPAGSAG